MQSEAWPGQLSADHAHKLTWRPHHREFIYSAFISMCIIKILIRTRAGTRPGRLFARSRISRLAGSIEPGASVPRPRARRGPLCPLDPSRMSSCRHRGPSAAASPLIPRSAPAAGARRPARAQRGGREARHDGRARGAHRGAQMMADRARGRAERTSPPSRVRVFSYCMVGRTLYLLITILARVSVN